MLQHPNIPGEVYIDASAYARVMSGQWTAKQAILLHYGPHHFYGQAVMGAVVEPQSEPEEREEDMKSPFLNRKLKDAFGRKHVYNDVTGEVGLELECEGKSLFMSPISFWKAVPDGSLRAIGEHPPIEYVLRDPIERQQVPEALGYLARRLKAAGSELIFSHRCSVHVHINVLDMTLKEIANFLVLYFILEELLVEWSGEERAGNLFCLRAKDAIFQIELLVSALRTYNFGDVFNQNFRYSACNITSMGIHGSLEFRSMRGSVDETFISEWVRLLLHTKDMARHYGDSSEIGDEFMHMGPQAFLDKFLTDCPASTKTKGFFKNHKLLVQSLWDGYRTARDVAYAVDWNNPPSLAGKVSRTIKDGDTDYDDD